MASSPPSGWVLRVPVSSLPTDAGTLAERLTFVWWSDCDAAGQCASMDTLPSTIVDGVLETNLPQAVVDTLTRRAAVPAPPTGGVELAPSSEAAPSSTSTTSTMSTTATTTSGDSWFAVASTEQGPSGDFTAAPLAGIGAHQVGAQTGHAETSYDFTLPPTPVGPQPSLGLSYSSGAVDGMHSSTNNQAGVAGLGWNLTQASITRVLRGCVGGHNAQRCFGANENDGFAMTMNGVNSRLVRTGVTGTVAGGPFEEYKLERDIGWRIRRIDQGGTAGQNRPTNPVAIAAHPSGNGYWTVTSTGQVYAYGGARWFGGAPVGVSDIVGIEATGDGGGYWLVGRDGGVFAFGNAPFRGSLPSYGVAVNNVVAIAGRADSQGYWLVGSDGGVFAFSAPYLGNAQPYLNGQAVSDIDGFGNDGYWTLTTAGSVFSFGSAPFHGSRWGHAGYHVALDAPPSGDRYFIHRSDGETWRMGSVDVSIGGYNLVSDVSADLAAAGSGDRAWAVQRGGRVQPIQGAAWTPASHPDRRMSYWEVTTPDGTVHTFGRGGELNSNQSTESVRFMPVHWPGRGCHWDLCDMAYAWDLDRVQDTVGNAATYFYGTERNFYNGQVGSGSTYLSRGYVRASYLQRIEYGFVAGQEAAQAPMQVDITYASRNVGPNGTHDAPADLQCSPFVSTCSQRTPTMWTKIRLGTVTTKVRNGAGGWRPVQSWVMQHALPNGGTDPDGDPSAPKMVLTQITQQAADGTAMPPTSYDYVFRDNRVNAGPGISPMRMARLSSILTELGGSVQFSYGQSHPPSGVDGSECSRTAVPPRNGYVRLPCDVFPAVDSFTNPSQPAFVLWHKWKVMTETRSARFGAAPNEVLTYTYLSPPSWRYSEQFGHTKTHAQCQNGWGCNHWNDYRGHERVQVTDAAGNITRYRFHTGMDQDRLNANGGTYAYAVTDAGGTSRTDHWWLAGTALNEQRFGSGGLVELFRNMHLAWATQVAASWPTSMRITEDRDYPEVRDHTGSNPNQRRIINYYDAYANLHRTRDEGLYNIAGVLDGDETTTRWDYTVNTTNWIVNRPHQVRTWPGVNVDQPGPYLSTEVFRYDRQGFGAVPSRGMLTSQSVQRATIGPDPVWSTTTHTRNSRGQVTATTDPLRRTTTFGYDSFGHQRVVDPPLQGTANATTSSYDPAFGLPVSSTAPNSQTTTFTYDGLGRTRTVTLPGAPAASYRFTYAPDPHRANPAIVLTEQLRQPGAASFAYTGSWDFLDGFGRSIQTQTHHPQVSTQRVLTSTSYDNVGRVHRTSAPYADPGVAGQGYVAPAWGQVSSYVEYGYDTVGRTTERTMGAGVVQHSVVSHVTGLRTRLTDARGFTTTERRDIFGRLVQVSEPAGGGSTSYAYNQRGDLTRVTDAAGNQTLIDYANNSLWKTRMVDPDAGEVLYEYDAAGQLVRQRDARRQWRHVTHDQLGRVTAERRDGPAGALVAQWFFDATGQLGLLDRTVAHTTAGQVVIDYGYDARKRLATIARTIPGAPSTYTTRITPREAGTVGAITYPNGETVTTTYNHVELPVTVASSVRGTVASGVVYNPRAQRTAITRGNGNAQLMTSRSYHPATGRLAELRTTGGGTTPQWYTYTWDPAGNLTQMRDRASGVNQWQCFRYDNLHRLTAGFTRGDSNCGAGHDPAAGPHPYNVSYSYNAIGNITAATGTNTAGGAYTYAAGKAHAVTRAGARSYTYDAAGNTTSRTTPAGTQSLGYDVRNRLSTITGGEVTYQALYDADGNRVRRSINGTHTYYLGEGYELSINPAGTQRVTVHYHLGGDHVASSVNGVLTAVAPDHLGSGQVTRNTSGAMATQRYQPYGHIRGSAANTNTLPTDRTFTGQTNDPGTGLIDYRARPYDPWLGRFIQPDTIVPNPANPQDLNRYTYVRNNPLGYTDPTGRDPQCFSQRTASCTFVSGNVRVTRQYSPATNSSTTTTYQRSGPNNTWVAKGQGVHHNHYTGARHEYTIDPNPSGTVRSFVRAIATIASFAPVIDTWADAGLCTDSGINGTTADATGDCAGAALPLVGAGWIRLGRWSAQQVGNLYGCFRRAPETADDLTRLPVGRPDGHRRERPRRDGELRAVETPMTEPNEQMRALVEGMREAAASYRAGRLPLDRLVWELKSRIAALQGVADQEWVEELRSAWWQLESVNAFWIESGRAELTEEERCEVDEGLDEFLPMLVEY